MWTDGVIGIPLRTSPVNTLSLRHAVSIRTISQGKGWWLKYAPPLAVSDVFIMNRNNSGQQTTTCQHAQILYVCKVIHETSSLPVAHKSSHDLYHTETLVYLTQKWIGKRAVFITNFLFTINQPRVIWE